MIPFEGRPHLGGAEMVSSLRSSVDTHSQAKGSSGGRKLLQLGRELFDLLPG